jgi:nitrogen-specific signal transduction histidine kinase
MPAIEADRGQVQQAFMNLALNATGAIGTIGGLITVKTGIQNVDDEYTRFHPEAAELRLGKHTYLDVRDIVSAMDDATRDRIFDPLFTTKFMGRGLGLAAVAGFVRGHKARSQSTARRAKAADFTVLFPAAERAAEKPRIVDCATPLRGAGVK